MTKRICARTKQRSSNAVGTHCVIHSGVLALRTLPITMNDKLAIAVRDVNFVKLSSVKLRLFTTLCKNIDTDHEILLFHTAVKWLPKGNMLARAYELWKKVELFLEAQGYQNLLHLFTVYGFQLTLVYLVKIFESLDLLN